MTKRETLIKSSNRAGVTAEQAHAHRVRLQQLTRNTVFAFLDSLPRNPKSFAFQVDLLDKYNSAEGFQITPVTFGKLISEYVVSDESFSVTKSRYRNKSVLLGIDSPGPYYEQAMESAVVVRSATSFGARELTKS